MPTKPTALAKSNPVPIEYSGKWIAWSADHARIVAHADDLDQLWNSVRAQQVADPIFEKVLRADARFAIGPA